MLKASFQQAAWFQESKLPRDWWISTSQNGWMTDEIGLLWLKNTFEPLSKRYFDDFCKKNAIICLCMPAHASHHLQPLDVGVFSPLTGAYGKLLEHCMKVGNNHIDKEDFLSLYPDALSRARVVDTNR